MNLQSIQKRLQELSAEALTLSNDLEFLIKGEAVRTPAVEVVQVKATQVLNFKDVDEGDILQFTAPFRHIDDVSTLPAGNYKVSQVEEEDYEGIWSVMIVLEGGDNTWINFNKIASNSVVNRLQVA